MSEYKFWLYDAQSSRSYSSGKPSIVQAHPTLCRGSAKFRLEVGLDTYHTATEPGLPNRCKFSLLLIYNVNFLMSLYHIFSLIKLIVGFIILLSLYFLIDPFADPLIAISGIMLWLFLLARGWSFYIFGLWEEYIRHKQNTNDRIMYQYKLSLLFSLYILFNTIFLLRQTWTIALGIVFLILFILIQWRVLPPINQK